MKLEEHSSSIFKVLVVPVVMFIVACSDSSDTVSGLAENISVSALRDNENVGLNLIRWGYVNGDGSVSNWVEVLCESSNNTKQCSSLTIGFEADGDIRVFGLSELEATGSDTCVNWVEGQSDVKANPVVQQRLVLHLDQFAGACP